MNRTAELAYWINERELMRARKESGTEDDRRRYGWSDDAHMGTVRYCNVHRENDKVTRWLATYWRPGHHAVWEILLARLINNIPTLEELLQPMKNKWQQNDDGILEDIRALLKERRRYTTIFGSAYTVSTNGHSMDKVDYIIDRVLKPAASTFGSRTEFSGRTLAAWAYWLCKLNGVSTFMAGQIIADLKNTEGHPLQTAPDWWTWAAPGPGSLRGLTAYFGQTVTPKNFTKALTLCHKEVWPHVGGHVAPVHMQDFQNCMCEFSKYVRVKEGGHARNRYAA